MSPARQLSPDLWSEYFDAAGRELLNAPASIEITTGADGSVVEAASLALTTLTYDRRGDIFEVAVARGGPHLPSVLRHMVTHPARIEVDNDTMLTPMTISVQDREGVRTVITIEREADVTG